MRGVGPDLFFYYYYYYSCLEFLQKQSKITLKKPPKNSRITPALEIGNVGKYGHIS